MTNYNGVAPTNYLTLGGSIQKDIVLWATRKSYDSDLYESPVARYLSVMVRRRARHKDRHQKMFCRTILGIILSIIFQKVATSKRIKFRKLAGSSLISSCMSCS